MRVFLLALNGALVQAEEDGDDLWGEEVGVVHLKLINSNISIIFCHAKNGITISGRVGLRMGRAGRIRGSIFGPFRS